MTGLILQGIIVLVGISKINYYKYKRELKEQLVVTGDNV